MSKANYDTTTTDAVIALGANLGEREVTLAKAVDEIILQLGPVVARSTLRDTEPQLPPDCAKKIQPRYLNGAVRIRTTVSPERLLAVLLTIEKQLGRDRNAGEARNLPRAIDLDLVAYGDKVIHASDLEVPHPRMHERKFVLEPMAEVWPEWRHPVLGRTTKELLISLEGNALSLPTAQ